MKKRLSIFQLTVRLVKKAAAAKRLLIISTVSSILNKICHAGLMICGACMILVSFGELKGTLLGYSIAMLCFTVGIFVFRYLDGVISHTAAYFLLASMRESLYRTLRRLAPACLTGRTKGDILSVAIGDIETIERFFAHTIGPLFTVILLPIGAMILIACADLRLALIILPVYILNSIVIPVVAIRSGRNIGTDYRRALADLKSLVLESVTGIRDIQIFGDGQRQKKKMIDKTREISRSVHRLTLYQQAVSSIPSFFIYLTRMGFVLIGASLINDQTVTPSQLILLSFLVSSTLSSTQSLIGVASSLIETYAAAERIFHLEDMEPEITEESDAEAIRRVEELSLDHVSFRYAGMENDVLRDVTLTLRRGDSLGIEGESGIGKSTFLRLLLRFWNPTGGEYRINGRLADSWSLKSLHEKIGLLEQDTFLFNDTIAANIALGKPDASPDEIRQAAAKAGIDELISGLPEGYQTQMGEMGDRLSGGEKQRIGIARLLLYDPDVIIMDEPTSNLDAFNEKGILYTLAQHCGGKTMIIVSHRKSTLTGCKQHARVQNGNLVLNG